MCHARYLFLALLQLSPSNRACVCALVLFSLFLRFSIDLCLSSFSVKLAGGEESAESKKLAKKNYDWKFRVFTLYLFQLQLNSHLIHTLCSSIYLMGNSLLIFFRLKKNKITKKLEGNIKMANSSSETHTTQRNFLASGLTSFSYL